MSTMPVTRLSTMQNSLSMPITLNKVWFQTTNYTLTTSNNRPQAWRRRWPPRRCPPSSWAPPRGRWWTPGLARCGPIRGEHCGDHWPITAHLLTTLSTGTAWLCAMWPRMLKVTTPARRQVPVFTKQVITVSWVNTIIIDMMTASSSVHHLSSPWCSCGRTCCRIPVRAGPPCRWSTRRRSALRSQSSTRRCTAWTSRGWCRAAAPGPRPPASRLWTGAWWSRSTGTAPWTTLSEYKDRNYEVRTKYKGLG